jgi:hypothetical protein
MRACIVAQSPDEFISGMIGFKEYHHKWAFSVRRAVMISGEDRVLQVSHGLADYASTLVGVSSQ